ncbi:MAG: hypothetical protein AB9846_14095 [Tenuifilaceae bacterium]
MRHLFAYTFSLSFLILSCNNRKTDKPSETKTNNDSIPKVENVSNSTNETIKDTINKSFQEFWIVFRNAVIENDTNKLVQLTKFPLETRGPLDSDPLVKYEREQFMKVFNAYLEQTTSWIKDVSFISSLEEIKRIPEPDKRYIQNKWARVGNLEFIKENGLWLLGFAYLEYPTIDKLNEK